jgi:ABC-type transporter Mla subunit MlaD
MSIFDAYVDDLAFLEKDVRSNLAALKSGDNVDALVKTLGTVFDQADDLLKQAEVEARSFESRERKVLNEKLKSRRDTFAALRAEYDNELFQSQKAQLTGKSGEDRGRMLDSNEK